MCLMVAGGLIPPLAGLRPPEVITWLHRIGVVHPMACCPAVEVCAVPNGGWGFETPQAML